MAVFLYENIGEIMLRVMDSFVLSNVLSDISSRIKLLRINLEDNKVLLPASSINVGFLEKVSLSKIRWLTKLRKFCYNVKVFPTTIVEKL